MLFLVIALLNNDLQMIHYAYSIRGERSKWKKLKEVKKYIQNIIAA